jgi:hypothetical protein
MSQYLIIEDHYDKIDPEVFTSDLFDSLEAALAEAKSRKRSWPDATITVVAVIQEV